MGKKHLTLTERVKIETLIKEGYKLSTIAKRIGYSRAAISKEIQRSTLRKAFGYKRPTRITKNMYSARYAQTLADHKKQSKYFSWNEKKTDEKKKLIADYVLNKKWSPEQIANGVPKLGISTSTIYNWINHRQIPGLSNKDLRTHGKRYKRAISLRTQRSLKQSHSNKRIAIKENNIEHRPLSVNSRRTFGHWEMDGVESMQSKKLVLTFVERKTRFAAAVIAESKHAKDISKAIASFCNTYQDSIKSITCDRGTEFLAMTTQYVFKSRNIKYYYAHAYSPYERGSNENFNRLFREYFPKKTNFSTVTDQELSSALESINARPMRLHKFKSRHSAFKRMLQYRRIDIDLKVPV